MHKFSLLRSSREKVSEVLLALYSVLGYGFVWVGVALYRFCEFWLLTHQRSLVHWSCKSRRCLVWGRHVVKARADNAVL